MWQAFKIAFSMYSAIPMPKTDWNERNMRYAMCFFPLIGVPIGALLMGWLWLCETLAAGTLLTAAVCAVIPVLVTGGIHLDGFCDTVDALSSHQTMEKKLEILKDSHTGAFAILGAIVYFLLDTALWSEYQFTVSTALVLLISFVLSRTLSALALVIFHPAKNSGLLRTFSDLAQKRTVRTVMLLFLVLCFAFLLVLDWKSGTLVIVAAALAFWYYHHMSQKQFGGITGDLAGYFVTLCEWFSLLAVVLAQKI
jgi:adenosylcobinamide-GDP ribazoletransferase